MTMPLNLVLVRHGESEGNVAVRTSRKGDDRHYTEGFRDRHSSQWRLSDKGVQDAQTAGAWLRGNHFARFDRYYVSEYVRARETAALLGLKDAEWYRELRLRERDRGWLDVCSHAELREKYGEELARWERSPLIWAPPGGESMANVCARVDRMLATLHRECEDQSVIIVCHGEVMWAFCMILERMTEEQYVERDESKDQAVKIYNGQIIHYSRLQPGRDHVSRHLDWKRMIRADDKGFSREWRPVVRPRFSNLELLEGVRKIPRLVND